MNGERTGITSQDRNSRFFSVIFKARNIAFPEEVDGLFNCFRSFHVVIYQYRDPK